jgi:thymidylate synthase (FAD)
MKLIKPSYEIFEQGFEEQDIYKQIEKVGRTCYKSEDKITDESAKPFVDRMISSKHYAMLEHGTVYLKVLLNNELILEDAYGENNSVSAYGRYINNKYSKVNYRDGLENIFITDTVEPGYAYITTNLRVLVENDWLDDLQYICEPTEYHEKRHTVKFICDRGVSHEFVRHRAFSFAQESTRYCNYSKEKFGNELTFIIPVWLVDLKEGNYIVHDDDIYRDNEFELHPKNTCEESFCFASSLFMFEDLYKTFIDYEWKAQQARNLLPNALKTELVMTGFESDWKHFFDLRAYGVTGKPHPQASELAIPLLNEFIEKGYLHG